VNIPIYDEDTSNPRSVFNLYALQELELSNNNIESFPDYFDDSMIEKTKVAGNPVEFDRSLFINNLLRKIGLHRSKDFAILIWNKLSPFDQSRYSLNSLARRISYIMSWDLEKSVEIYKLIALGLDITIDHLFDLKPLYTTPVNDLRNHIKRISNSEKWLEWFDNALGSRKGGTRFLKKMFESSPGRLPGQFLYTVKMARTLSMSIECFLESLKQTQIIMSAEALAAKTGKQTIRLLPPSPLVSMVNFNKKVLEEVLLERLMYSVHIYVDDNLDDSHISRVLDLSQTSWIQGWRGLREFCRYSGLWEDSFKNWIDRKSLPDLKSMILISIQIQKSFESIFMLPQFGVLAQVYNIKDLLNLKNLTISILCKSANIDYDKEYRSLFRSKPRAGYFPFALLKIGQVLKVSFKYIYSVFFQRIREYCASEGINMSDFIQANNFIDPSLLP
jgi:hypothetical protein